MKNSDNLVCSVVIPMYYEEDVVCEDEIVQYRIDAYKKITFNS